jgi:RNA polymerase sigma-70 factor (ECF subfamily)
MFSDSDEELMNQVAGGDLVAFSLLYDKYAPTVLEFGLKLNLETAVADQIVLETFWMVWQQAETFSLQSTPFPVWLRRLARQVSLNNFRYKIAAASQQIYGGRQ